MGGRTKESEGRICVRRGNFFSSRKVLFRFASIELSACVCVAQIAKVAARVSVEVQGENS